MKIQKFFLFFSIFLMMTLLQGSCSKEKKSTFPADNKKKNSGVSPFQFPDVPLAAKPGEFVLAPPERIVKAAYQKKKFFPYYRRELLKVGPEESLLKINNRVEKIPNVLIIPIGSSKGARLGDIVLTSNSLGKHPMARGIVAELGDEGEPMIHYLEVRELSRLDNRKFKSEPGTFRVLKSPGEPGSELVCRDKERFRGVTLLNSSQKQHLVKNAIGGIQIFDKKDCEAIPLRPQVQEGDKVYVPIGSFYREGRVKKIEDRLGRLYIEYNFGKLIKERTFPYGVVATNLPVPIPPSKTE